MRNIIAFFLLTAFNFSALADDSLVISGTPPREERESKTAFKLKKGSYNLSKIKKNITASISSYIKNRIFYLPGVVESSYKSGIEFTDFVFDDTYFDDDKNSILKSRSAYRLRYRFRETQDALIHSWGGRFLGIHPSRVEVQFKGPYRRVPDSSILTVKESRFEYRNEAEPFSTLKNAPKPPWPRDEFINHTKEGRYKHYLMLPYHSLRQQVALSSPLKETLRVITQRHRMHLKMNTPWGSGPNPDHVFIVTLDISRVPNTKEDYLEVEIEIDRNTSENMEKILATEGLEMPYGEGVRDEAVKYTKDAYTALLRDQQLITSEIREIASSLLDTPILQSDFKYARLSKISMDH